MAAQSWDQYAEENGLTAEQKQAGLDTLAKGDLPEDADIAKVIVEGYKGGVLIAGAAYLGPAASAGKVIGGGVLALSANGGYQYYDLSKPGNYSVVLLESLAHSLVNLMIFLALSSVNLLAMK